MGEGRVCGGRESVSSDFAGFGASGGMSTIPKCRGTNAILVRCILRSNFSVSGDKFRSAGAISHGATLRRPGVKRVRSEDGLGVSKYWDYTNGFGGCTTLSAKRETSQSVKF